MQESRIIREAVRGKPNAAVAFSALLALLMALLAVPGVFWALRLAPPSAPYIPLRLSVIVPIRAAQLALALGPCALALALARRAVRLERAGRSSFRGTQVAILALTIAVLVAGYSIWQIPRTDSGILSPENQRVEQAGMRASAAVETVLNWAHAHNGQFPASLNQLNADDVAAENYVYLGAGLRFRQVGAIELPFRVMILYEKNERQNAGRVAAYNAPITIGAGKARWIAKSDWESALKESNREKAALLAPDETNNSSKKTAAKEEKSP